VQTYRMMLHSRRLPPAGFIEPCLPSAAERRRNAVAGVIRLISHRG